LWKKIWLKQNLCKVAYCSESVKTEKYNIEGSLSSLWWSGCGKNPELPHDLCQNERFNY